MGQSWFHFFYDKHFITLLWFIRSFKLETQEIRIFAKSNPFIGKLVVQTTCWSLFPSLNIFCQLEVKLFSGPKKTQYCRYLSSVIFSQNLFFASGAVSDNFPLILAISDLGCIEKILRNGNRRHRIGGFSPLLWQHWSRRFVNSLKEHSKICELIVYWKVTIFALFLFIDLLIEGRLKLHSLCSNAGYGSSGASLCHVGIKSSQKLTVATRRWTVVASLKLVCLIARIDRWNIS